MKRPVTSMDSTCTLSACKSSPFLSYIKPYYARLNSMRACSSLYTYTTNTHSSSSRHSSSHVISNYRLFFHPCRFIFRGLVRQIVLHYERSTIIWHSKCVPGFGQFARNTDCSFQYPFLCTSQIA